MEARVVGGLQRHTCNYTRPDTFIEISRRDISIHTHAVTETPRTISTHLYHLHHLERRRSYPARSSACLDGVPCARLLAGSLRIPYAV